MSNWTGPGNADPAKGGGTYDWELTQAHASTPACAEDLVEGKLALNVSMTATDNEPVHTGKWSQEEVRM